MKLFIRGFLLSIALLFISLLLFLENTSYAFGVSRNVVIHDDNSFEIEGLAFENKEKEFMVMVVTGEITDPSRWKIINQQSVTVDKNNYFSITTPPFESKQVEQNKVAFVMINDNTPLVKFYDYPFSDRKPEQNYKPPVEVDKDMDLPKDTEAVNNDNLPNPKWTMKSNSSYFFQTAGPEYDGFNANKDTIYFQLKEFKNGKVNDYIVQSINTTTGKEHWSYDFRKNVKMLTFGGTPLLYGKNGDVYFTSSTNDGKEYKTYSVNSKGNVNWVKTFKNGTARPYLLSNGNLAVVEDKGNKYDTRITIFNPNGKQVSLTKLKSRYAEILNTGHVISNYPSKSNTIEIFKNVSSLQKPIISHKIAGKYSGMQTYQLSGGTIILDLISYKDKVSLHNLHAYNVDGKLMWKRSLPKESFNKSDPLVVVGDNFLLRDTKNKTISLYNKNNKLLSSTKKAEYYEGYQQITPSGDITFSYGTYNNSKWEDKFYALNGKNLSIKYQFQITSDEYQRNEFYYVGNNTLYRVTDSKTVSKYILK
ncbi:hypothetical protein AB4Z30_02145 [Paenibacillus sp. 2TAF8]|uniref:hypothetical protein n=1 Tax=Paenibacillus sp. 2TAF8 TaxID=3233020 RepID=UPI003F9E5F24